VSTIINIGQVIIHPRRMTWALKSIGPVSEQPRVSFPRGETMLVVLTNTQKVAAGWGSPVDAKGDPAQVQNLTWKTSDAATATAEQDPAVPYGVIVKAVHAGAAQVWPEADADLGDGVTLITGDKLDVTVTGGQAVGFGPVTIGTPTEQ
jgi:hypothetical protein